MSEETTGGSAGAAAPRYAHLGEDRYSAEAVKRLVPLQWAFGELLGLWDVGPEMRLCPFHVEDTPSFNLWGPDDAGVLQRFGCFGCGVGGDVIDLIQTVRGVDFNEAVRIAIDELAPKVKASGWSPTPAAPERSAATPEQLERVLESLGPMGPREFDAFRKFMQHKDLVGEDLERYAMEEWGWTATTVLAPTVIFPHRDWEGRLTGIKYRAVTRNSRWNEPGSRFPALYGAWRDHGYPTVLVAEGETDTVFAAFQLRDQPIDVFGMPSGANQKPTAETAERLKGRTVYVCGDGDRAGFAADKLWYDAGIATYVVRMPEGEDILSCHIPVKELLERRAFQPRDDLQSAAQIKIKESVFVRTETKIDAKTKETVTKTTPIADFAFVPERELITDDGPAYEGKLTGFPKPVLLRNQDLADLKTFRRWAHRQGGRAFVGTSADVELLVHWIGVQADYLPLEETTSKAGRFRRSYVWPGHCIGPDRVRYIPPVRGDAALADKIWIEPGPFEPTVIQALEQLNDPGIMAAIIGWLVASLMREKKPQGKNPPCPPLFIAGESGAGKTSLVRTVLESFGFGVNATLTTTTPFGVDSLVSSCVGFPVWFDEYRLAARNDAMERLRQILRDAYNGQVSVKGGMTTQATELTEVTTLAGIVVSGEMGTSETSLRDRLVYIELDPDARQREPYDYLLEDPRRTAGLGDALLRYLVGIPPQLFQPAEIGSSDLPDRFRRTLGFIDAGWTLWLGFRQQIGLTDTPVGPSYHALARMRQASSDPWLEALRHAEGVADARGNPAVEQVGDNLRIIPSLVIQEAERAKIELPAGERELLAWLRRRYRVTETRVGSRRGYTVHGLDLDVI